MENLKDIGTNYAATLKDWRKEYLRNIESISAMGFNHIFQRKWEYYLSICEAGFAERVLGDIQVVFSSRRNRIGVFSPELKLNAYDMLI